MSTTRRHSIELTTGFLHVDITEADDEIRFQLSGAMASEAELPKFRQFFAPLVFAYDNDPRPCVVSGFGSPGRGAVGSKTPPQALSVDQGLPLNTPISSDWHRVGARLSVQFTLKQGRLDADWLPRLPTKRETKRVLNRYRQARHAFLAELGSRLGGPVALVEALQ